MLIRANWRLAAWVVLAAHCSLAFLNGFQWANLAFVPREAREVFSMTDEEVNVVAFVFSYTWIPGIAPAVMTQQRLGPVGALRVSAAFNLVGSAIKLVALWFAPSFWCFLLGQIVSGFSEVFFLSLPPLLASAWFPERWRGFATALASLANSLGTALASGITAPIVQGASTPNKGFQIVLVAQAIAAVVVFVWCVALPLAPTVAPSVTAEKPTPLRVLLPALKSLVRDRSFMCVTIAGGLGIEALWAVDGMSAQVLKPFGVSEVDAGFMGSLLTLLGAAGQFIVGRVVDKTRDPFPLIVALVSLTLAMLSAGTGMLAVGVDATAVGYVMIPVIGLLMLGSLPAQFDFIAELTYGHPLAAGTGLFMIVQRGVLGNSINNLVVFVLGNSPRQSRSLWWLVMIIALYIVAVLCLVLGVSNTRKRLLAERQRKDLEDDVDESVDADAAITSTAAVATAVATALPDPLLHQR